MNVVAEVEDAAEIPLWRHPVWEDRLPWLLQGTTGVGGSGDASDFGFFGQSPVGEVVARWQALRRSTEAATLIHSFQVHGHRSAVWRAPPPAGLLLVEGYDGHLTDLPGVLLTVSIADCVPVFLAFEEPRVVGLVHAGWRGVAAGVLENALDQLATTAERSIASTWMHCGPSICGRCYEVGPEVHSAVYPDVAVTGGNAPIDLAAALADRALRHGLDPERVSRSGHCTRCGPGRFFSHRGGSRARQLAVIALRRA